MSIGKLKEGILRLFNEVGYFERFEIIDETANTLKVRLIVNKSCCVQIYVNLRKEIKNYVVVLSGQRVYGRDRDSGNWHVHPWGDSTKHEKAKEVPLREFLFEVYEGLRDKNIL